MDDPLLVRRFESFSDLPRDWERFVHRNRRARDALCERVTLDQLYDERADSVAILEPVNGRDVRVIERGEHFGFTLEAREPIRIRRDGFGQDLQRDIPLQSRIARAIDLAHAARAQGGLDFIRPESSAGTEGHVWRVGGL